VLPCSGLGFFDWLCVGFVLICAPVPLVTRCLPSLSVYYPTHIYELRLHRCTERIALTCVCVQRGTRDTPNSMGAERQRNRGQTQTKASHTKHTHIRRGLVRPTQVSIWIYRSTSRYGRKDPPAGNKARCNRTNTPHSKATQRKAKPNQTPQTHTGRKTGLNSLSRGLPETAHRGLASGTRCDVRARPIQGCVAPAKGNAKLPERPRDEGGPRKGRPASLHRLVGQVPSSVRAGAQRRPKDSTDIGTQGRAEDTCR
jgi:hypothetical protein